MTVAEEYRAFINANVPHIHTAQYAIESSEERAILLMTDKQFKMIVMEEPKDRVMNFKDVKDLKYAEGQLIIEGNKGGMRIPSSEYDYTKILQRWDPPATTEEPSE